MNKLRWHVVVLDDRKEFAIHVWRYLNRSLGVGIAPTEDSSTSWMPEGEVMPFIDGTSRFSWLHADGSWKGKLEPFLQALEPGWGLLAIVDMVGKGASGYNPQSVRSYLEDWERGNPGRIEMRFVSAYNIKSQLTGNLEIWPKSRSTLNEIGRLLYSDGRIKPHAVPGAKHVLVTGAGFEIKGSLGGFGMLPTAALMERMDVPFQLLEMGEQVDENRKETIFLKRDKEGFPCPTGDRWDRIPSIRKAAKEKELDLYWDILLTGELKRHLGEHLEMKSQEREQVSDKALFAERQMREAFRRSIHEHDWGHMKQSLAAAQLRWHAWLTTNYTRFADRAIALMARHSWRVIATAAEANTSVREDNWFLEKTERSSGSYRYLFKLHGDVGHLHTMAIAGHDKAPFSLLSTPVDDLYQVYASAERFLGYSLISIEAPVVWHIVGHAMRDRRLVNLIRLACEQIKGEHLFLITDPQPEVPLENIKSGLLQEKQGDPIIKFTFVTKKLFAEEYMARLEHHGLPSFSELKALLGWFENL